MVVYQSAGSGLGLDIETAEIQDNAVTTAKILNDNVTLAKLAKETAHLIAVSTLASDGTTFSFTSLDSLVHRNYKLVGHLDGATGVAPSAFLYANGDTTNGNYDCQRTWSDGAGISTAHRDDPWCGYSYGENSGKAGGLLIINAMVDAHGYFRASTRGSAGFTVESAMCEIVKANAVLASNQITQLDIISTGNFEAGSWVELYGYGHG